MNGNSNTRWFRTRGLAGTGAGALAVAIVAASCGGDDGGGPAATAAAIDSASVASALGDISAFMPVCDPTAASARVRPTSAPDFNALVKLRQGRLAMDYGQRKRALALTGTKPADVLGSCGGRYGYTDYSHVNGVTTGTLAFTDYCTSDTASGERTTVSGSVGFVDTATPTPSGPITTRLEANSAGGVTIVVRDAAGQTLSSERFVFTGFAMTVGNPGGEPTAASPDRLELAEAQVTNQTTGKTYRQTGWTVTDHATATGGEQMSMTGRGYRSSGAYYDIATTAPIVFDAAGNTVSGAIGFTGANGDNAVATLVPGATLQASLTVNGTPLPNLPACTK